MWLFHTLAIPFQEFNQKDELPLIIFLTLGIGFFIYHFTSEFMKKKFSEINSSREYYTYYGYLFQRILGFLTFGLLPSFIFIVYKDQSLTNFGFNLQHLALSLLWTIGLGTLVGVANYFLAGKKENLRTYPQIRLKIWTPDKLLLNAITWAIYLLGYEFMFRGLLLFSFYEAYGATIAITVNCIAYALVHIPKGKKETFGSIPLGILLSIITLQTGSIFVAFWFHVIMALTNDYFAIKAHPSMDVKIK